MDILRDVVLVIDSFDSFPLSVFDLFVFCGVLIYISAELRVSIQKSLRLVFQLAVGILSGLLVYPVLATVLNTAFHFSPVYTIPLSFMVIFVAGLGISYFIGKAIVTTDMKSKYASFLIGIVSSVLAFVVVGILLLILPSPAPLKNDISRSIFGKTFLTNVITVENAFRRGFLRPEGMMLFVSSISEEEKDIPLPQRAQSVSVLHETEERIVGAIQNERSSSKRSLLRESSLLHSVARRHAEDLATRGVISTISSDSLTPIERITRAGSTARTINEFVSFSSGDTFAQQGIFQRSDFQALLKSPHIQFVGVGAVGFKGGTIIVIEITE